jgi:formylglycine-generating enzyme required for sulfatase activity
MEHRKNPTEHEKDRFISAIRDILSQPGTSESWLSLCRILDSIRAFEVSEQVFFVEYLKQHIEHWPSGLRRPFYAWWEHQRDGHLEPVWELVGDTGMWLWDAGQEAGEKRSYPLLPDAQVVWCPPGSFLMGRKPNEPHLFRPTLGVEIPQRQVTLTSGFWMLDTPITQEQYSSVMSENPSHFAEQTAPVECVNWHDAQVFCKELESLEPGAYPSQVVTCWRLPTEAEWEYAYRAGTDTMFYNGTADSPEWDEAYHAGTRLRGHQITSFFRHVELVDEIAWYYDNSERQTHPIRQKKANNWGLYDMAGNVSEWVYDEFAPHSDEPVSDPIRVPDEHDTQLDGIYKEGRRLVRGGSYGHTALYMRAASGIGFSPETRKEITGFRLVKGPMLKKLL